MAPGAQHTCAHVVRALETRVNALVRKSLAVVRALWSTIGPTGTIPLAPTGPALL
jgi:hypothetical protein